MDRRRKQVVITIRGDSERIIEREEASVEVLLRANLPGYLLGLYPEGNIKVEGSRYDDEYGKPKRVGSFTPPSCQPETFRAQIEGFMQRIAEMDIVTISFVNIKFPKMVLILADEVPASS